MLKPALAVFIGGGVGSLLRWLISVRFNAVVSGFFWGTFVSNAAACLLFGIFFALFRETKYNAFVSPLLLAGFCGGFSTFSAFTGEFLWLVKADRFGAAFGYAAGSLVVCLGALWVGMKLVKLF